MDIFNQQEAIGLGWDSVMALLTGQNCYNRLISLWGMGHLSQGGSSTYPLRLHFFVHVLLPGRPK